MSWIRRSLAGLQLAFVAAPLLYWDGGLIESEATQYVPRYLDARSVVQKVFDPRGNDFGAYQARELSYLIDWADAHVLDALLRLGLPVFVPASAVVSSLLTLLVVPRGAAAVLPRAGVASELALLLYLSSFTFVTTMGVYYRSGKLLVPTLLALLLLLTRAARGGAEVERAGWYGTALFGLAGAASLLDRQGFFMTVVAGFLAAIVWLATRRLARTLTLLAGAVLAALAYNALLGPALIRLASGYWPSFKYQQVYLGAPLRKPERLAQAAEVLAGNVSMLLGGLPAWAWAPPLLAAVAWGVLRSRTPDAPPVSAGGSASSCWSLRPRCSCSP